MKKFFREWRGTMIIGILLLAAGILLRLMNLTILPVFADEAIYIRWSQIMANEPTLRFLPLSDGKQPLFMWILMFLVNRFSDPLFIGRLLSVVASIVTMLGVFALSYILFKDKLVSLVALLLYILSPFTFFFDRMALVDSMLTMFGVWTVIFGLLAAKTLRLDWAMFAGFSLGFASLTKSPAIFFALLFPVTMIFAKSKIRFISLILVTYILAFGMYNIQRLGPNFHLLNSRTQDYIFPISHLWQNPKDPFAFHFQEFFFDWLSKMGPWPILVLWFLGSLFLWLKHKREFLLLTSYFLLPTLVQSEFAKVFTARYQLFTLPFLFMIAAAVFATKVKQLRIASYVFLALFVILAMKFDYLLITNPEKANLPRSEKSGYLEEWTAGQGIKEISEYLKNQSSIINNQKIVVGTEGYFGTLPDGLQMYLADTPEITVIGVGIDIKELPQSLKESKKTGNKTYLVVNKSRLKADPTQLGLKLIAEYPKVPRPADTREYIIKGPQEFLYFYEIVSSYEVVKI